MTFTEYQALALRTASKLHADPRLELAIFALGLCGEAAEFRAALVNDCSSEEAFVEAGDVLWYTAVLAHRAGLYGDFIEAASGDVFDYDKDDTLPQSDAIGDAQNVQDSACMVAEHIKKHVGHGKPLDKDFLTARLSFLLSALAFACPGSLGLAAIENIEKLKKRYPDGFKTA